ncbi:MAG: hypothetical protein ACK55I_29855, partial [bacterium]
GPAVGAAAGGDGGRAGEGRAIGEESQLFAAGEAGREGAGEGGGGVVGGRAIGDGAGDASAVVDRVGDRHGLGRSRCIDSEAARGGDALVPEDIHHAGGEGV